MHSCHGHLYGKTSKPNCITRTELRMAFAMLVYNVDIHCLFSHYAVSLPPLAQLYITDRWCLFLQKKIVMIYSWLCNFRKSVIYIHYIFAFNIIGEVIENLYS